MRLSRWVVVVAVAALVALWASAREGHAAHKGHKGKCGKCKKHLQRYRDCKAKHGCGKSKPSSADSSPGGQSDGNTGDGSSGGNGGGDGGSGSGTGTMYDGVHDPQVQDIIAKGKALGSAKQEDCQWGYVKINGKCAPGPNY